MEDEEDEDDEGELALWSPDVQVLELHKARDKGLGFSILDYQVPNTVCNIFVFVCQLVNKHEPVRRGGASAEEEPVNF